MSKSEVVNALELPRLRGEFQDELGRILRFVERNESYLTDGAELHHGSVRHEISPADDLPTVADEMKFVVAALRAALFQCGVSNFSDLGYPENTHQVLHRDDPKNIPLRVEKITI